jgi:hypothetical protein
MIFEIPMRHIVPQPLKFEREPFFKGGQETNCCLNNLVYSAAGAGGQISLLFFQTADYKAMEAALRSALKCAWNRI